MRCPKVQPAARALSRSHSAAWCQVQLCNFIACAWHTYCFFALFLVSSRAKKRPLDKNSKLTRTNHMPSYAQMRYQVVLPPLQVTAAHASGSAFAGQSHQQVPPFHGMSPPPPPPTEAYKNNISTSKHKQGDWSKNSSKVRPPNRRGGSGGDGSSGGEGRGSSSASAIGEPREGQQRQQQQLQQPQQQQPPTSVSSPLGTAGVGGGIVVTTSRMRQRSSDGEMSRLNVLSHSAASETTPSSSGCD